MQINQYESQIIREKYCLKDFVYADNFEDALGAIRTLTGDNEIKPFESEERKQFNKGKTRWLEDDIIFEVKE